MYFWKIKVTFIIIIIQAILMPEKLSNSDILSLCCWKKNVSVKVSSVSVKENLDTTSSAALFSLSNSGAGL